MKTYHISIEFNHIFDYVITLHCLKKCIFTFTMPVSILIVFHNIPLKACYNFNKHFPIVSFTYCSQYLTREVHSGSIVLCSAPIALHHLHSPQFSAHYGHETNRFLPPALTFFLPSK